MAKFWYEDGKQLKAERKRLGLTQAKLAKLAGVSQSLVAAVERNAKDKGTDVTRRHIANELVRMKAERIKAFGATPNKEIKSLREALAHSQAMEQEGIDIIEKQDAEINEWKKRYDALLDVLNLETQKALTESEKQEKIAALGLQERVPVDEPIAAPVDTKMEAGCLPKNKATHEAEMRRIGFKKGEK
ncbi:MAG: helix-turn-helix domain-containing protein [Candidatus Acidiferrales bacterium]